MKARIQKNIPVRNALSKHGLYVCDLVDILKVSETTVTRMMRHELPKEEQKRIIGLIEKEARKNER
jgi:hypothetical protein